MFSRESTDQSAAATLKELWERALTSGIGEITPAEAMQDIVDNYLSFTDDDYENMEETINGLIDVAAKDQELWQELSKHGLKIYVSFQEEGDLEQNNEEREEAQASVRSESIKEMLGLLKNCPDGLGIEIDCQEEANVLEADILDICAIMRKHHGNLDINFSYSKALKENPKLLENIREALLQRDTANNIKLGLEDCGLNPDNIQAIADLLAHANKHKALHINIGCNSKLALSSEDDESQFSEEDSGAEEEQEFDTKAVIGATKLLFNSILASQHAANVTLAMQDVAFSKEQTEELLKLIESEKCPPNTRLLIDGAGPDHKGALRLAKALMRNPNITKLKFDDDPMYDSSQSSDGSGSTSEEADATESKEVQIYPGHLGTLIDLLAKYNNAIHRMKEAESKEPSEKLQSIIQDIKDDLLSRLFDSNVTESSEDIIEKIKTLKFLLENDTRGIIDDILQNDSSLLFNFKNSYNSLTDAKLTEVLELAKTIPESIPVKFDLSNESKITQAGYYEFACFLATRKSAVTYRVGNGHNLEDFVRPALTTAPTEMTAGVIVNNAAGLYEFLSQEYSNITDPGKLAEIVDKLSEKPKEDESSIQSIINHDPELVLKLDLRDARQQSIDLKEIISELQRLPNSVPIYIDLSNNAGDLKLDDYKLLAGFAKSGTHEIVLKLPDINLKRDKELSLQVINTFVEAVNQLPRDGKTLHLSFGGKSLYKVIHEELLSTPIKAEDIDTLSERIDALVALLNVDSNNKLINTINFRRDGAYESLMTTFSLDDLNNAEVLQAAIKQISRLPDEFPQYVSILRDSNPEPLLDAALPELVRQCSSFPKHVNLSVNFGKSPQITPDGFATIINFIQTCPSKLSMLDFTGCTSIMSENSQFKPALELILNAVQERKYPFNLYLDGCTLTSNAMIMIGQALKSGCLAAPGSTLSLADNASIQTLISVQDPEDKSQTIEKSGFQIFCEDMLQKGFPEMLAIDLNDTITEESLPHLLQVIESPKCPNGLHIVFAKPELSQQAIHDLSQAMLKNTSIHGLDIEMKNGTTRDQNIIEFCAARNKMLAKYPKYADAIKHFCKENDLLIEEKQTVPKLSALSALSMLARKPIAPGTFKEQLASLPGEVREFIGTAQRLQEKLQGKMPTERPNI